MAKHITTADEVFTALGGVGSVAERLGAKYNNVCSWKSRGWFPPKTYLALTAALAEKGKTASPELWCMAPVRESAR